MGAYLKQQFKFKDYPQWIEDDDVKGFVPLQSYNLYGFLADVRNICKIPTVVAPRGKPKDFKDDEYMHYGDFFGFTYFSLQELLDFDYEQTFENLRVDGGRETFPVGQGVIKTIREELGENYFKALDEFKSKDVTDIFIYFS